MLPNHTRTRWPRAVVYGLTAIALLVLACEAPWPTSPGGAAADPAAVPAPAAALAGVVPATTPGLELPERVAFPPPHYPRMLLEAGVEGEVLTTFIVGTDGRVEPGSIQILQASHAAFVAPTRNAIEQAVFRPGRLKGEAVRVQVQSPMRFVVMR